MEKCDVTQDIAQLNVEVITSHDGQHGNEPTISVAVQRDLEQSASIELRSEEQSINYIAQVPDIDPVTSFGVQLDSDQQSSFVAQSEVDMQTHSVVQSDLLSSYVAHTELDRAMNSIVKFEMNPSASYLLLQRDSDKSSCSVDQPNLSQTACPVKHSTCATAQLDPDDSTVGMFSFRQIIPVPKALERLQLLMPRSSRYHHIKWIRK